MKIYLSVFLLLFSYFFCRAQRNVDSTIFINDFHRIEESNYKKGLASISSFHPNINIGLSENLFDSLLVVLSRNLPTDSIKETQFIYEFRKMFDQITLKDPHFRILPELRLKDARIKAKDIKVLPFSLLCLGDTLVVEKSLNENVKAGDRLIALDSIPALKLIDYTYRDRYINTVTLQAQNHYHFNRLYYLTIERNGRCIECVVEGIPLTMYNDQLIQDDVTVNVKNKVGYIRFDQFSNNKYTIKCLNKLIDKVKKADGNAIIIDLRHNVGGSGDYFDDLLSIFCNKKEIPYQKGIKLKVSKATLDYGFSKDSIGRVISLPDSMFYSEIPLKSKLYRGELDYYILVSKNTQSQAATFSNIIQYNNLGKIVGEPLHENALRFGEVSGLKFLNSVCYISTVEYDEKTKATDGILQPDIHIPYKASEYMKGGDPVLEKLLEYIKIHTNKLISYE